MKASILLLFLSSLLFADPLNSSLEVGTSISHYYDSRSVFTNPAALSYQTLLNSARLTSSVEYAVNENMPDNYAVALAYGMIGIGAEKLSVLQDDYLRFSLAGAFPFGKRLFVGGRYSVTSSDNQNLKSIHSLDLGLQYRASRFVSFGFMANRLNRPSTNSVREPIQLIAGISVMPHPRVLLQADFETSHESFGDPFGYQVNAHLELFKGVYLSGGYHHKYQYQAGLKISLGRISLLSTVQPASDEKKAIFGIQTLPMHTRSLTFIPRTLHLVLDNSLSDEGNDSSFFAQGSPSLLNLLEKMRQAESDPAIKEITLEITDFPLGLASAEEVTESVLRLRNSGKKITAIIGNSDTKLLMIASAATEVIMDPDAELRILGPRSEHFYAKGLLDKVGIEAEFLARGEYKSFPETFTRKNSSEPSRRSTMDQIQKMEDEIVSLLGRTRKITKETWKEVLKTAILTAEDAKRFKLVDRVEKNKTTIEVLHKSRLVTSGTQYYRHQLALPTKVAVITAQGNILKGRKRALSLLGEDQVTPEKLEAAFSLASSDPNTKAIVLRVVSPGGEILPSSQIASLIEKTSKDIPVYISMGDVAASGGYMISASANKIFSDRLTYTGSIGVFLGKVSLSGLYKKLDVNKEILGTSPYAGIYSESKSWNTQEKQIMTRLLDSYYTNFVKFVSTKRKIDASAAESAAKGRVWLGADAKRLKLVDEIGGLTDAIAAAAKENNLGENYEIWEIRPQASILGSLGLEGPFGSSIAETFLGKEAYQDLNWMASLKEEPFLYFNPVKIY